MAGSGCSSVMLPWEGLPQNKQHFLVYIFLKCLYCVDGELRFPGSSFCLRIQSVGGNSFLHPLWGWILAPEVFPCLFFFHTSETQAKRDLTLILPAAGKLRLRLIKKRSVKMNK